jgi:hypothetical protein
MINFKFTTQVEAWVTESRPPGGKLQVKVQVQSGDSTAKSGGWSGALYCVTPSRRRCRRLGQPPSQYGHRDYDS